MNRVVAILVIGSLISLIYNPTFSFAQGTWKQLPATPTIRTENSAVLLKGKIYVLGGFTPRGMTTRVDVWNPISKNWSLAEPLPRALHHTTARVVNEKIYVIGGFESGSWKPVNTTYEYVPELNKWFNKTPMPTARGAHAAAVINGKIYLVGGAHRKLFKLVNTNAHEVYNPSKDSWKKLSPLPTPRDHLTATAKNEKLFAIGGRINVNYQNNLNSNESYNPKTGKWTQLAPLPTARSGVTSELLRGWIHVLGGESSGGTFVENEGYNPEKNKWKTFPPMPIGLHGLASVLFMGKIHLLNGGPHPAGSGSNHHLTFSE
ncbi:MAG: kelch repeat-containing protein [Nitrospinota bacterium]|nr:kelch repeat-containing protein [Nitrospinota bacterium]